MLGDSILCSDLCIVGNSIVYSDIYTSGGQFSVYLPM